MSGDFNMLPGTVNSCPKSSNDECPQFAPPGHINLSRPGLFGQDQDPVSQFGLPQRPPMPAGNLMGPHHFRPNPPRRNGSVTPRFDPFGPIPGVGRRINQDRAVTLQNRQHSQQQNAYNENGNSLSQSCASHQHVIDNRDLTAVPPRVTTPATITSTNDESALSQEPTSSNPSNQITSL